MEEQEGVWIFGYGSLMWNPSFKYERSVTGFVKNWARRFWQGSTDHRGIPGSPGRVVTLVPQERSIVHGVCYKLREEDKEEVLSYLNFREKGGYSQHFVEVWESNEASQPLLSKVLLYIAMPDNEEYLGPACTKTIAKQIKTSVGPSGPNIEYFMKLVDALHAMGVHDEEHIQELFHAIKGLEEEEEFTSSLN